MTQRQSQVKVLSIHEFAQICRTTPRTLRFYEKLGLLSPASVDRWTKYRGYHPEQARDFLQIKLLQDFAMPLKKIQLTIKQHALEEALAEQLKTVKQTIEEKQKEYIFLQTMNEFLFTKPNIKKYLKQRYVGPFSLLFLHISKGDYDKVTEYLAELKQTAQQLNISLTTDEFLFYGGTLYQPKHAMLDVAIGIKGNVSTSSFLPSSYHIKHFPRTKALVFSYTGPYQFLTLIYPKLFDYLNEKKIELSGQVFDWYRQHPQTVSSQYEHVTELVFPLP